MEESENDEEEKQPKEEEIENYLKFVRPVSQASQNILEIVKRKPLSSEFSQKERMSTAEFPNPSPMEFSDAFKDQEHAIVNQPDQFRRDLIVYSKSTRQNILSLIKPKTDKKRFINSVKTQ